VDAGKNQNILQQWPHWLGDLKVIEHTLEHHADLPDVSVLYGAVIREPKVTLNRASGEMVRGNRLGRLAREYQQKAA